MLENKYYLIDKTVIAEGCAYNFAIYSSTGSTNNMKCLKDDGVILQSNDIIFLNSIDKLYVSNNDYQNYIDFYNYHKPTESVEEPLSISQRMADVYKNGSAVLSKLFSDPEKINNYQESKKVVNNLVENVLDDDFSIKLFMNVSKNDFLDHTHSLNVSVYALSLGVFLGLSKDELNELGEAALLHDLGKTKINSDIVNKKGLLTKDEFNLVKRHPLHGFNICLKLGIKNKKILDGIKHHHEKIDGSGYPSGLYKENIPLYSQIISLCDIFDAITSQRSYKNALSSFDAFKHIKLEMNNHIDIALLNNMIKMFR